jgi:GNAT superfamily N-acetyltransferase
LIHPSAVKAITADEIRTIEELAFSSWPAEYVEELDGWRLRYLAASTHRGNSVWPNQGRCTVALGQLIAAAERFYADRSQRASFHVSPLAAPAELDAVLAARGYVIEAPVFVQTVAIQSVLAGSREGAPQAELPRAVRIVVTPTLTERWFALAGRRSRFAAAQQAYRELLERLGRRAAYALAFVDDAPAATALGVIEADWLGLHSMLTQPEYRGHRLAGALLQALCAHAAERGVRRAYLQVEQSNTTALNAYARAGFRTAYATHYRSKR